jgi:hypothetical protein
MSKTKFIDKFLNRLVYLTITALGAGMIFCAAHYSILILQSENWTETSGTVFYSYAAASGGKARSGFVAKVVYHYSVNGVNYAGNTLSHEFSRTFLGESREAAEARLNAYPNGAAVTVFYDPAAPEYSCLVKGGSAASYLYPFALGAIFAALGSAGIWRSFKRKNR